MMLFGVLRTFQQRHLAGPSWNSSANGEKRKLQEMLDTRNLDTIKTKRNRREDSFTLLSGWMLGYFEMQCVDMGTDVL